MNTLWKSSPYNRCWFLWITLIDVINKLENIDLITLNLQLFYQSRKKKKKQKKKKKKKHTEESAEYGIKSYHFRLQMSLYWSFTCKQGIQQIFKQVLMYF